MKFKEIRICFERVLIILVLFSTVASSNSSNDENTIVPTQKSISENAELKGSVYEGEFFVGDDSLLVQRKHHKKPSHGNLHEHNNLRPIPANDANLDSDKDSHEDITEDNDDPCLIDTTAVHMSWWVFPNGTLVDKLVRDAHVAALDLSHLSCSVEKLYQETAIRKKYFSASKYLAFSAAGNQLQTAPFKALAVISKTLSYLTLRGNDFSSSEFIMERDADMSKAWSWADFPFLPSLLELDISNCSIRFLGSNIFANFPNLEGLYLSQNKIMHISSDLFQHVTYLTKLDLSHIDSSDISTNEMYDATSDISHMISEGLSISESALDKLTSLIFLDLSRTKLSPHSVKALSRLGSNLQFLSLCYTSIPVIPSGMFNGTSLKVLDLSGNPTASLTLQESSFMGINDSLEILAFENSRLHDLAWIKYLENVEIINLCKNNINILHRSHFAQLKNLRLLDLSFNHIVNWYHRIFEDNTQLRMLNLRNNNVNMITSEMYRDFANLSFLAIGHNDFICNCALRDLIDVAVSNIVLLNNAIDAELNQTSQALNKELSRSVFTLSTQKDLKNTIESQIIAKLIPLFKESQKNILTVRKKLMMQQRLFFPTVPPQVLPADHYFPHLPIGIPQFYVEQSDEDNVCHLTMPDGELLYFRFVLLDYEPINYWCYNATTNSIHELSDLDSCDYSPLIPEMPVLNATHYMIIGFSVLTLALVLTVPLYLKWWYIKYFLLVLKRSAAKKLLRHDKHNPQGKSSSYAYDLFVSYCDKDRDWVLDELLPQIEGSGETSICLHERDFQVGLSILENIIQCMDKSRCFLLVISKCFLSSQWCQFEMYLAQHRLFEAKKEHLILIMLEDIPKRKRPKSLQYLMQIKTYIKWPTQSSSPSYIVRSLSEERKLFWLRLKRSILNIERKCRENENNNESTV